MNKNREMYNAIKRRKTQNEIDCEFKKYIKRENPKEYLKAVIATNRTMEKRKIIRLINKKILDYKEKSKYDKNKRKWGNKILALHELLYELGD